MRREKKDQILAVLPEKIRGILLNHGLDFEKILTTFKECGYDGNFCTEIFQIPSMEEAAAGAIRHLRPIADRVYGRKV